MFHQFLLSYWEGFLQLKYIPPFGDSSNLETQDAKAWSTHHSLKLKTTMNSSFSPLQQWSEANCGENLRVTSEGIFISDYPLAFAGIVSCALTVFPQMACECTFLSQAVQMPPLKGKSTVWLGSTAKAICWCATLWTRVETASVDFAVAFSPTTF